MLFIDSRPTQPLNTDPCNSVILSGITKSPVIAVSLKADLPKYVSLSGKFMSPVIFVLLNAYSPILISVSGNTNSSAQLTQPQNAESPIVSSVDGSFTVVRFLQ